MRLKDRVIIITGASGGLGRHIVRLFLSEGAKVVGAARDKDKFLHALPDISANENERLFVFSADLIHWEEAVRLKDETLNLFGRIDGLIHSMGGFKAGKTLAETEEKEWDSMMSLNLKSAFFCIRAVWPVMQQQRQGKILTVSAMAALNPKAKRGIYQISKAALVTLTQSLAEEGKEYNIQVNSIAPSVIDTKANKKVMPEADHSKWVKPEEIAKLCAFLCSEDSNDVTGSIVQIPGRL